MKDDNPSVALIKKNILVLVEVLKQIVYPKRPIALKQGIYLKTY